MLAVPPKVVRLQLGKGVFSVNAYLLSSDAAGSGFVLVDTGMRSQRALLTQRLAEAGCAPGSLRLIVITHGDADHIGNAAHLRRLVGAPIAMHAADVPMARDADMFAGRNKPGPIARTLLPLIARLPAQDRFEPDVVLDEDSDLAEYGLPGTRILPLAGHSAGSIALLLEDGSLICGDLLENRGTPKIGSIMDDVEAARASVGRLREITPPIGTVYPGHGTPFQMNEME